MCCDYIAVFSICNLMWFYGCSHRFENNQVNENILKASKSLSMLSEEEWHDINLSEMELNTITTPEHISRVYHWANSSLQRAYCISNWKPETLDDITIKKSISQILKLWIIRTNH